MGLASRFTILSKLDGDLKLLIASVASQRVVMACLRAREIVGASIDTDGTDGTTDAAGGILDGYFLKRANTCQLDVFESLRRHATFNVLSTLNDTIYTGATGTNVMNLRVLAVLRDTKK